MSEQVTQLNRQSAALRIRANEALHKSRRLRDRCSGLSELIAQQLQAAPATGRSRKG